MKNYFTGKLNWLQLVFLIILLSALNKIFLAFVVKKLSIYPFFQEVLKITKINILHLKAL